MTIDKVNRFLSDFTRWAAAQMDIQVAALVGSYTRGAATPTSDVDLVSIAAQPASFHQEFHPSQCPLELEETRLTNKYRTYAVGRGLFE